MQKAGNREFKRQKDSVLCGSGHHAQVLSALDGIAAAQLSTDSPAVTRSTSALLDKIASDSNTPTATDASTNTSNTSVTVTSTQGVPIGTGTTTQYRIEDIYKKKVQGRNYGSRKATPWRRLGSDRNNNGSSSQISINNNSYYNSYNIRRGSWSGRCLQSGHTRGNCSIKVCSL